MSNTEKTKNNPPEYLQLCRVTSYKGSTCWKPNGPKIKTIPVGDGYFCLSSSSVTRAAKKADTSGCDVDTVWSGSLIDVYAAQNPENDEHTFYIVHFSEHPVHGTEGQHKVAELVLPSKIQDYFNALTRHEM